MTIGPDEPQAFSLPIDVQKLPRKGRTLEHVADLEECAVLARQYDLVGVGRFEAKAHVRPWKRDGVEVSGHVSASITQPCAVTGDPIDTEVEEDVEVVFVPEGSKLAKPRTNEDGEWVFDVDGDDLPETFSGPTLDVATVLLEYFALGIDPFARAVGAVFESDSPGGDAEVPDDSPFSALAKLKIDRNSSN